MDLEEAGHPDEDPVNWDYRYGRYLFAPLQFGTDNTIRAYWLKEFDWKTYVYGSEVFDEHDHGTTGNKNLFENKLFAVLLSLVEELNAYYARALGLKC